MENKICKHCGMLKAIRNPSGFCDHLHYPEYCDVCTAMQQKEKDMENKTITVAPIQTAEATKAGEDAIALHSQAQAIVIVTQPDYEIDGTLLQKIKGRAKEIEVKRKEITKPLDVARKLVMELFRTPLIRLGEAELNIKQGLRNFDEKQEHIRKEQEEKLRKQAAAEEARKKKALEEQARKKEEEARKLREAAEKAGAEEKARLEAEATKKEAEAEAKRDKKEEVHVEAPVLAPRVETPKGISYKDKWTAEVVDFTALPDEYKIANMSMLNKIAQATKGQVRILGVKFSSAKIVSSRS